MATPHEDIRQGRLDEAVFAANLWAVVQGTAARIYLDPEEFFRKSYMTSGLGTILNDVKTEDYLNHCTYQSRLLWANEVHDGTVVYTGAFNHWFTRGQ